MHFTVDREKVTYDRRMFTLVFIDEPEAPEIFKNEG